MGRRSRRIRYRRPLPLLLAVFLVVVMLALVLHWREQRRLAPGAGAGTGAVVAVPAAPVDPAREGRSVQVSGRTSASSPVLDPLFGVSVDGIALLRRVEMLQWQERIDSTGAAVYVPTWSEALIPSDRFLEPAGHGNPARMPFESVRLAADAVRLGDFLLGPDIVARLAPASTPIAVDGIGLPENLAASFAVHDGVLHTAADPSAPEVGDLRIAFEAVPHQSITVVARQVGRRLEPIQEADGSARLDVRLTRP